MHCGEPVMARTPLDDARHSRLTAATPAPLVDKMRASTSLLGERRLVTVLFADVVGSTALSEQVEADAWLTIMNRLLDRITPAIYRYEGTVARLLGDGLWAFFGAPVAHEDDPVRAVRAALDLLALAATYAAEVEREFGIALRMRACLNTGHVVVGPVGDDLRYAYAAEGATVSLAARLKLVTQPMTVAITENTCRFVSPVFDWIDLGLVEDKGGGPPVRVYQVTGPKAKPGRTRGLAGLESPMVGRDAELGALLHLGEAVRAGLGRAVLVVGEPGVGKTRLIAEWKSAMVGMRVVPGPLWIEGHGLSYGQGLPYHLLADLLRSALGVPLAAGEAEVDTALRNLTQELLRQGVGAAPGDEADQIHASLAHLLSLKLGAEALRWVRVDDPQALQAGYLTALRRLLQAMARQQPLVLILEDLHWADPSSTELLIRLLNLAAAAPVLFCFITRPERDAPGWRLVTAAREVLGGSLTEIGLGALSEADSRKLVSNLLQIEALPDSVRALILQKAEGNPFFVEEVIRMLIDRGAIVQQGGDWVAGARIEQVEIPDNLRGLLLARIDRLPEAAKQVLRVAAVIGRQFPVRVLEQILEMGEAP